MNIKLLKLKNGETIIGTIKNGLPTVKDNMIDIRSLDPFFSIHFPLKIEIVGTDYHISEYMPLASFNETLTIDVNFVIGLMSPNKTVLEFYINKFKEAEVRFQSEYGLDTVNRTLFNPITTTLN